jgi:hypothetical protein
MEGKIVRSRGWWGVVVVLLCAFVQRIRTTHWLFRKPLQASAFERGVFHTKEVDTYYYQSLTNITEFQDEFVLYRALKVLGVH